MHRTHHLSADFPESAHMQTQTSFQTGQVKKNMPPSTSTDSVNKRVTREAPERCKAAQIRHPLALRPW
jgi:hypothetical protein